MAYRLAFRQAGLVREQKGRTGAGRQRTEGGAHGWRPPFKKAHDDQDGDGLKRDEHGGNGGGQVFQGRAGEPDASGRAEKAADRLAWALFSDGAIARRGLRRPLRINQGIIPGYKINHKLVQSLGEKSG